MCPAWWWSSCWLRGGEPRRGGTRRRTRSAVDHLSTTHLLRHGDLLQGSQQLCTTLTHSQALPPRPLSTAPPRQGPLTRPSPLLKLSRRPYVVASSTRPTPPTSSGRLSTRRSPSSPRRPSLSARLRPSTPTPAMTVPLPLVTPLARPSSGPSSRCGLGATVTNLDLAALFDPAHRTPDKARSSPAFKALEDAVYRYKVVVVKHQERLGPDEQYEVVKAFDPAATGEQGHNDATVEHKGQKSLLYGIGNAIGTHPEVKLVGGGVQSERFGGRILKQADHVAYHKHPLTEDERDAGLTRWHRWHMDAALFRTSLPLVTSLLCLATPSLAPDGAPNPRLTVRWDDGSGLEMDVEAGSTGFVAGSAVHQALSEEEQKWCDERVVEYAPWPYQWNGPTRGNSNGLGTFDEPDNTMPLDDLPPWEPHDIKTYPLVWTHHRTGEKALLVHSVAVRAIHHPPSGTSITSLSEVRARLAALQRWAFVPERIYAHGYEVGDLVIFDNRAVYHSATDYPDRLGTRTMLQAHVAASFDPE